MMKSPAEVENHGRFLKTMAPSATISPHDGVGGRIPRPKKLKPASVITADPRVRVA